MQKKSNLESHSLDKRLLSFMWKNKLNMCQRTAKHFLRDKVVKKDFVHQILEHFIMHQYVSVCICIYIHI